MYEVYRKYCFQKTLKKDYKMNYECEYCGYKGKEVEFLSGICPACCRDNITGQKDENAIPLVFHIEVKEIKVRS